MFLINKCIIRLSFFLWALTALQPTLPMFRFEEEDDFAHELRESIEKKDLAKVNQLSQDIETARLNMCDQYGKTLLGYAIETGNVSIVRQLLEEEVDPNAETHNKSPLMLALLQGNREIIDLLLLFGARDSDEFELFHQAIKQRSPAIIGSLVRAGFNINAYSVDHSFPLVDAIFTQNQDVIETCLRLGADREMVDGSGRTVLKLLQDLQTPDSRGTPFCEKHLKKIGDAVIDGSKSDLSDQEIIHFLQKAPLRWGPGQHKLAAVKKRAKELGSMFPDEAIEVFSQMDRNEQKEVIQFVPLHLYPRLKNHQSRRSPANTPDFEYRDEYGTLTSIGSRSCVLQ